MTTDAGELARRGIDVQPTAEETVYVRTGPDAVEISVYFDADMLARVGAGHESAFVGLNDFCLIAEGVSHFVFLVERAGQARQTTAFEMELQAEVDKFLLLTGVDGDPSATRAEEIHARLFNTAALRGGLEASAIARYGDANRYAARYCRYLQRLTRESSAAQQTIDVELRRFYHLPLAEKIQRIESRPSG